MQYSMTLGSGRGAPADDPAVDQRDVGRRTIGRLIWFRTAAALAVRPGLWVTALRQWLRISPVGWWRRPPFLPIPPRRYLAFRFDTAYGRDGAPQARDVVAYLEWCRRRERPGRNG
jgi:hypothetical protein